jgi:hypothetical protein
MVGRETNLFGSVVRTRVLVAIALLQESYPRELARLCAAPLMSVQRAVNDFDQTGVTASRVVGTQRQVRLNPRYFARPELEALLLRLAEGMPELEHAVSSLRRRPRRAGKALT